MKIVLIILLVLLCFQLVWFTDKSIVKSEALDRQLRLSQEYAYFEGQKDAINNDIRIKKIKNKWEWVKSCWDDGKPPVWTPYKSLAELKSFVND